VKISYKTYLNDRLKQVDFHGQLTYPLYIQVTYERKTIFFKSYYFELFSKSRYGMAMPDGSIKGPEREQVIEKENEVFRFVIDKMKKMPHMAELIKWGTLHVVTYDLIMDFKKILKEALYDELIEQAFEKAPPYIQLYSFMIHTKKWPMLCLTAMEWDNMESIRSFKEYVELHYPTMKSSTLIGQVNSWPNYRRKAL
jgi:hypothetical protein